MVRIRQLFTWEQMLQMSIKSSNNKNTLLYVFADKVVDMVLLL